MIPIPVTEEEFRYLEECLMCVNASKVTDPIDEIKLELLERALDSREGNYLYPLSNVEKNVVESLLRMRNE